jgi:hypothetical protein
MTAKRDDPMRDLQSRIGMSPIKMMAYRASFAIGESDPTHSEQSAGKQETQNDHMRRPSSPEERHLD